MLCPTFNSCFVPKGDIDRASNSKDKAARRRLFNSLANNRRYFEET